MRTANLYERQPFAEPHRPDRFSSAPDYEKLEHALAHWIEAEGRARVLVDDALRVCWLNPSAESLMSGPNSILIRNGHIRTRENRFDRQLRELIDGAASQMSTCCLHDAKAGEHLVLTAVRLSAPSDDMVGLTLLRATEDFPFRFADLHSAFGLTQTESRVAYHLMCGRTAEEASQELGVSLETVRTHIKRAYAKLGVCSREGFFHRLTPFVILLT
ncbi:helix-turn-helix transcriptional regulator [Phenylobacterium sp. LjRoot225]|uniref:helix-turn-helix transcriptional regulator n=1 Tax=Phenylobacterium sp. LjRoot225 TaxID=3342285 RepID=UPI003ECECF38